MKPTLTRIEYHKNPNQAFPVAAAQFCTIGTPNFDDYKHINTWIL